MMMDAQPMSEERRYITPEQFDTLVKAASAIPVSGPNAVAAMNAIFATLRELETQVPETPAEVAPGEASEIIAKALAHEAASSGSE